MAPAATPTPRVPIILLKVTKGLWVGISINFSTWKQTSIEKLPLLSFMNNKFSMEEWLTSIGCCQCSLMPWRCPLPTTATTDLFSWATLSNVDDMYLVIKQNPEFFLLIKKPNSYCNVKYSSVLLMMKRKLKKSNAIYKILKVYFGVQLKSWIILWNKPLNHRIYYNYKNPTTTSKFTRLKLESTRKK